MNNKLLALIFFILSCEYELDLKDINRLEEILFISSLNKVNQNIRISLKKLQGKEYPQISSDLMNAHLELNGANLISYLQIDTNGYFDYLKNGNIVRFYYLDSNIYFGDYIPGKVENNFELNGNYKDIQFSANSYYPPLLIIDSVRFHLDSAQYVNSPKYYYDYDIIIYFNQHIHYICYEEANDLVFKKIRNNKLELSNYTRNKGKYSLYLRVINEDYYQFYESTKNIGGDYYRMFINAHLQNPNSNINGYRVTGIFSFYRDTILEFEID